MPHIIADNVSLHYPIFGQRPPKPKADGAPPAGQANAPMPIKGPARLEVQALQNVSFEVNPGERLGLIGRNGSGKSTLLRVLGGVYEPTAGRISVDGHVAPLFNVGLGMRREATGRRNIVLRGLMRGLTRKEAEAKIDEIIEFSELGEFIDMPVRTYSTGMAMRLTFATATAFSPEILLLDEWIGAGDQPFQKKAKKRMFELVDRAGITVIASHRDGLIRQVCSHCLWLDKGVVRAFGPADAVLDEFQAFNRKA